MDITETKRTLEELEEISSAESLEEGEIADDFLEEIDSDESLRKNVLDRTRLKNNGADHWSSMRKKKKRKKSRHKKKDLVVISDSDDIKESTKTLEGSRRKVAYSSLETLMTEINKAASYNSNLYRKRSSMFYNKVSQRPLSDYKKRKSKICDISDDAFLDNTIKYDCKILSDNPNCVQDQDKKFDFDLQRKELLKILETRTATDFTNIPMEISTFDDGGELVDENKENEVKGVADVAEEVEKVLKGDKQGSDTDEEELELRLLALSSNKRKQSSNDRVDTVIISQDDASKVEEVGNHLNIVAGTEKLKKVKLKRKYSNSGLLKGNRSYKKSIGETTLVKESDEETQTNELLLRAEALKTAFLKKHQKGKLKTLKSSNSSVIGEQKIIEEEGKEVVEAKEQNTAAETYKLMSQNSHAVNGKILLNPKCYNRLLNESAPEFLTKRENTSTVLEQKSLEVVKKYNHVKNARVKQTLINNLRINSHAGNYNMSKVRNGLKLAGKLNVRKPPKLVEEKKFVIQLDEDSSDEDNDTDGFQGEDKQVTEVDNKTKGAVSEASIDKLLLNVRKTVPSKSLTVSTPEAVYKHLPLDRRIEYIQLKKQIAQKELNSKTGKMESSVNLSASKKVIELKNPVKIVQTPKKQSTNVVKVLDVTRMNINQLKLLLKDIKNEKQVEHNYDCMIKKLKVQLHLLEKKKNIQRLKIDNLVKRSKQIYRYMTENNKPKRSKKLSISLKNDEEIRKTVHSVVDSLVTKVVENEKHEDEETLDELMEWFEKNVAVPDKNQNLDLDSSVVETDDLVEVPNTNPVQTTIMSSSTKTMEYVSPLIHLNMSNDKNKKIDPYVILCPFQLMGTCRDNECKYQHH